MYATVVTPLATFFSVFDGHGGTHAAQFASKHLLPDVVRLIGSKVSFESALRRAFLATDRALITPKATTQTSVDDDDDIENAPEKETGHELTQLKSSQPDIVEETQRTSGTTATVVAVTSTEIFVAHVGDTRAVLARSVRISDSQSQQEHERLCDDHRADRPDEAMRIERAGGLVMDVRGIARVNGTLAVSRSLGDAHMTGLVTADPDVTVRQLTGDETFIVVASDGLWDVVSDADGVAVVHAVRADAPKKWLEDAAKALVELAWERGSHDDICAMIIDVQSSVPDKDVAAASTPLTATHAIDAEQHQLELGQMTQRKRTSQKPW